MTYTVVIKHNGEQARLKCQTMEYIHLEEK